jgi:hypothetical protein
MYKRLLHPQLLSALADTPVVFLNGAGQMEPLTKLSSPEASLPSLKHAFHPTELLK